MTLSAGNRVGRYEVVDELGAGGMGQVFRARDPRVDREVAIKVLPEGLVDNPDLRARFEKEARAAGAINHPNLLTLFDVVDHDGKLALVTELLEGETLRARMRRDSLSRDEILDVTRQIARGLSVVHDRDIIHRDIKPSNVFLCKDGTVKILDFGLARQRKATPGSGLDSTVQQTRTGAVLGTPRYMSPEQVRGREVDHRTDIFSLGVVLYELVAGAPPFEGESEMEVAAAILEAQPKRLGDKEFDKWVQRCLAKAPNERWSSVDEFLDAMAAPEQRPSSRVGYYIAGFATVAAAAVLLWTGVFREQVQPVPKRIVDRAVTTVPPMLELINPILSRDGSRLAYLTARDSPIIVLDIDRGSPRTVKQPEALHFRMLDFFPDGRALIALHRDGKYGFFRMDLDTQKLTTIVGVPKAGGPPISVSPGGDKLLYTAKDGVRIIAFDGSGDSQVMALPEHEKVQSLAWSPDGKSIAVVRYRTATDSGRFLLQIAAADGSRIEKLSETERFKDGLEWDQPGRLLYATKPEPGGTSIMSVEIVDGRFRGEPKTVRAFPEVGLIPWIRRRGDQLFYMRYRQEWGVKFVDYKPAGEKTGPAVPFEAGRPLGWRADGKFLFMKDGNVYAENDGEGPSLVFKDLGRVSMNSVFLRDAMLFWRKESGVCTLLRVADGTAEAKPIYSEQIANDNTAECPMISCARDREDSCVTLDHDEGSLVFRRFDLKTGASDAELHRAEVRDNRDFWLSNDGKRILYAREKIRPAIVVVDLETKQVVEHKPARLTPHDVLELPEGKGLLVTGGLIDDRGWVLTEYYPGQEPRVLYGDSAKLHSPRLSPDGTKIMVPWDQQHRNIWVLDGFR